VSGALLAPATALGFLLVGGALHTPYPRVWLDPFLSRRAGGALVRRVLGPALLCVAALGVLRVAAEGSGLSAAGVAAGAVAVLGLFASALRSAVAASNAAGRAQARAVDALQASEQRIRQLLESLPVSIWTSSPEGSCDFLSPQGTAYTGAPLSAHFGFQWLDFAHPDDRARTAEVWTAAATSGSDYCVEYRARRHDGVYRWFHTHGVPVRDRAGQIVKWVGCHIDIDEAHRLREQLRQQALLIDLAHDPVFAWSPSEGITFWNRGCEQLYGYSKSEAQGRSGHELLRTVFPRSREAFERELARDKRWAGELRHTTRDGRKRILASRLQCIEIDGQISVLEADRDITEQRWAEESLRRSQRMEALGVLAGGIAHDFNNIIAAIQGNTQLAAGDLTPDHPAQESLTEVNLAVQRASQLVLQILTFSRQEPVEHARVALQPVIREVLRLLRSLLPPSLELRAELCNEEAVVLADASQIHQVIMNLVTNAAHAIADRPGRVGVSLARIDHSGRARESGLDLPHGRYLRLSVQDDGCGMDPSTRGRIFEPFFTTKSVGQGTGLGLSVVHGIMKSHGGAIRVQSEPGRGSTFSLYFLEAGPGDADAEVATAEAGSSGRGERLLYVDDDRPLVALAVRTLERLGYRVQGHVDPVAAIDAFRASPSAFAGVITDLYMPSMSGIELAQELLRIRADLPVVVVTGRPLPEDVAAARRSGVRDLLHKPSAMASLGQVVHTALHGPAALSQAPVPPSRPRRPRPPLPAQPHG